MSIFKAVGGIIGSIFSDDDEIAEEYLQKALKEITDIKPQQLKDLVYKAKHYADALRAKPIDQQMTELNKLKADNENARYQRTALRKWEAIASAGGNDATATAQLQGIEDARTSRIAGDRETALQGLQQQGLLDSGANIASAIEANRQVNRGAAQASRDAAISGQNRQLSALKNYFAGAGQVRTQKYGEGKDKATAQDSINRANVLGRRSQEDVHIARQNKLNAANTDALNRDKQREVDAKNRLYDSDVALRKARAGIFTGYSEKKERDHAANIKQGQDIGEGIDDTIETAIDVITGGAKKGK